MKVEGILRELSALRNELAEVKARVDSLEREFILDGSVLDRRLKGRGLKIHRRCTEEKLLIPADLSPELTTAFYERMKKYSFRLFLRDLISVRSSFSPGDLTRYCSSQVAEEYTRFLSATGTVIPLGEDRYALNRSRVSSFGPTLEWFVAEMFRREFACPALFGVDFRETKTGGDYDVLALWEGRLVYVEVKSSPPKSIEDPEIAAFFARLRDLIPDVAFFFNDTHLRMKDKVIQIFSAQIAESPQDWLSDSVPEKVSEEIYQVDHWIYILNSKRDIVRNFSLGLRDHLRAGKNRHL